MGKAHSPKTSRAVNQPETGGRFDTAAVITTEPNELIADLPHHRMPVVLAPSAWETWLNPTTPMAELQALLRPAPPDVMGVRVAGPKEFTLD